MRYTKSLLFFTTLLCVASLSAQSLDVSLSANVCLEENVQVTNTSVDISEIYWNFCNDDFDQAPTITNVGTISSMGLCRGTEIVEDLGNYYGFLTDFDGELYLVDYGSNPENPSPTIDEVEYTGFAMSSTEEIGLYKVGSEWYGFVGSASSSVGITRLDFGTSLNNTPNAVNLGNFGFSVQMRDLQVVKEGDDYILLILDTSAKFIRVNYGTSITSGSPTVTTTGNIAGLTTSSGFDLELIGTDYYGLVTSINGNDLAKINFGSSVLNEPSLEASYNATELTRPFRVEIINNLDNYFAVVTDLSLSTSFFDLGDLVTSSPSYLSYDLSNGNSYSSIFHDGSYLILGQNGTGTEVLEFYSDCGASIESSDLSSPDFSYSSSGTKEVGVWAFSSDGEFFSSVESVIVDTSESPDISVEWGGELCKSVSQVFTVTDASSSGNEATTLSWDFDGDDVVDLVQADTDVDFGVPSYDYSGLSAGTYTVTVIGSNAGGCSNTISVDVTVYDAPTTPTDLISSGDLCTNSSITFSYADLGSLPSEASLLWDFSGEGVSTEDAPTYTFTTTGTKTIGLQVILGSCSTSVYSEDIDLNEGPEASFSFTGNCYDGTASMIQFTDGSDSDGTNYSWDFGDGIGSESSATPINPVYSYSTPGDYVVSLSVTSTNGCLTTFDSLITVTASDAASFSISGNVENEDIVLTGLDQTSDDDSVESWVWSTGGDELGTGSTITTAFALPGDYTIDLEVLTAQGCSFSTSTMLTIEAAQCPSSSFSLSASSYCRGESIEGVNSSLNSSSYLWTLCGDELGGSSEGVTTYTTGSSYTAVYSLDILDSVGVTVRNAGLLYHLDFTSDMSTLESTTLYTDESSNFSSPRDISLIYTGTEYYGLVANSGSSNVTRLSWGSDLSADPVYDDLSGMSEAITNTHGLDLIEDGGNYYGFVGKDGTGEMYVLDFGTSMTNTPSVSGPYLISDVSGIQGISMVRDCGVLKGLVTSLSDSELHLVSFDNGLGMPPSVSEIAISDADWLSPAKVKLGVENGYYYGFVQCDQGNVFRLSFGSVLSTSPAVEDLGSLSVGGYGIALSESSSGEGRLFGVAYTGSPGLYGMDFDGGVCEESMSSTEVSGLLTSNTSGTYDLRLIAYDAEGDFDVSEESVTILTSESPDIGFHLDDSRCLANVSIFTPSNTELTNYSWDFDGDGVEDSDEVSPTFDYSTLGAGTYTVLLNVNDGTCSNFYEEKVQIYSEPPVPVVGASTTSACESTEIIFTNSTDESQHTGVISYEWDFDNDGIVDSIDPNPTYSYPIAGDYTVSIVSVIPGCESNETLIDITVNELPVAAFFATTACEEETTEFTHNSPDAVSWNWDFSDGNTSISENPTHIFSGSGSYFVELTVTNANGCSDTQIEEVVVSDIPEVAFDFETLCTTSGGIQFSDLSTVDDADLVAWSWRIDDVEASTDQNPILSFESEGTVTVTLVATSSSGCELSYSEEVEILPTPVPDFLSNVSCLGEVSTFEDLTDAPGNSIVSWLWDVDGTIYTTEEIEHTFDEPGIYDVTLEVIGQNFCSESITKSVEVLQLPIADFILSGDCDNEFLQAEDLSTAFDDAITSKRWLLDGDLIGNGDEIILSSLDEGLYDLTLELETSSGCIVSTTENLSINPSPTAAFAFDRFYGIPDEILTATNSSDNASSYTWLVDGTPISSSATTQAFTFPEAGTYRIDLLASNSLGCIDTVTQEVLIQIPEVDLAITDFTLDEQGSSGRVLLEITNRSNLPVDLTSVQITLENSLSVVEEVSQFIDVGDSSLVTLATLIPLQVSEPAYFCVNLSSQYADYPDLTPIDNEECVTLEPEIVVENPFPNPVREEFRMKIVSPSSDPIIVKLVSSSGSIEYENSFNSEEGLNNLAIDMRNLRAGIYFVVIEVGGDRYRKKVVKF